MGIVERVHMHFLAGSIDVRRIRNSRGLRASTIARAEGHHELARLLHDMRPRRGALTVSPPRGFFPRHRHEAGFNRV